MLVTVNLEAPQPVVRPEECLSVAGLSVQFGGVRAISDVSLSLVRCSILGLIGPNGAGKTTFVNCLTGFQKPSKGRISLAGEATAGWRPDQFRRAGVSRSFQSVRLFSGLSVLENVEVAGVALGLSRAKARAAAREALGFMAISHLADEPVAALPYVAERQVGLARAIMGAPSFLLLDEPAAGMSEAEAEALLVLLRRIPATLGTAILLIEHNIELVLQACDRIHVLDGGRTLAEGAPDEIRKDENVIRAYLGGE